MLAAVDVDVTDSEPSPIGELLLDAALVFRADAAAGALAVGADAAAATSAPVTAAAGAPTGVAGDNTLTTGARGAPTETGECLPAPPTDRP